MNAATMDIRQLRYFLDIAQTEHLTASAQNLFVTQSTLSHGLRQLEEELQIQLFERLGRGLKLSQAGAAFRVHAARALQELEAGRMALADMTALQSGTLTVGVIPTFLHHLVPAAVAAFSQAYPRVNIVVRDLRAGPIETQLIEGLLDLGIAFHPAERAEIETEPLFDERLQLLVRHTHALAARRSLTMAQLADLPLALLTRSFATRRMIDDGLRAAGVQPLVRVEMESVEALIDVCRWSDLASIVPERAARQASDLKAIQLTAPQIVRHAGLLWRRGASRSVAAREFAALLGSAGYPGAPAATLRSRRR
jgi:LysR family transcriptional regulator, cyn operon transcriptional activator